MERTVFIFPGQGAQTPGMGRELHDSFEVARHTFEEADDLLERNLSKVIFEGPESTLTETQNSQPAIYVMSVACLRVLNEVAAHIKPTFTAGLSLGEYTAVHAAGSLTFSEGLKLVDHRARFMNEACEKTEGGLLVVLGLNVDDLRDDLPEGVWIANLNCPGQVVLSGTRQGLQKAEELAKAKGAKRAMPAQVHGAFHSGLMQEAEDQLKPYIEKAELIESEIPVIQNFTGRPPESLEEMRRNLTRQVTGSVLWEKGIRYLEGQGIDRWIEIGCGKVLKGLNRKIGVTAPTLNVESIEDLKRLEEAMHG